MGDRDAGWRRGGGGLDGDGAVGAEGGEDLGWGGGEVGGAAVGEEEEAGILVRGVGVEGEAGDGCVEGWGGGGEGVVEGDVEGGWSGHWVRMGVCIRVRRGVGGGMRRSEDCWNRF